MPIPRSAPISAVHKPAGLKSASHLNRAGTMRVCVAASQPRRRPAARFPSLDTGGPEHLSVAQAHLSSPVNVGPRRSGCVPRTRTYSRSLWTGLVVVTAKFLAYFRQYLPCQQDPRGNVVGRRKPRQITGQALNARRSQPHGRHMIEITSRWDWAR